LSKLKEFGLVTEKKVVSSPQYGNRLGHFFFYIVLSVFGPLPAYAMLHLVLPYYVLILRRPRRLAEPYLRRRFPGDSRLRRLLRAYQFYYHFAITLVDQAAMGILGRKAFRIEFPDWQKLYDLSAAGRGMVLLTTHFGYWKTAMSAVDDLAVPVNFLIHLEAHMDGRHFFDLAGTRRKIKVIEPTGFMGGLVEALKTLENGECVAIMGDRSWGSRTQLFTFLNQPAAFPITPYYLVSASNAELVMLLAVRTGKLAFRIDMLRLTDENTDWRKLPKEQTIESLLSVYVQTLENYINKYPYAWFNIYNFWSADKITSE
jgi:predicted LPLAT superfamily acyltransferase